VEAASKQTQQEPEHGKIYSKATRVLALWKMLKSRQIRILARHRILAQTLTPEFFRQPSVRNDGATRRLEELQLPSQEMAVGQRAESAHLCQMTDEFAISRSPASALIQPRRGLEESAKIRFQLGIAAHSTTRRSSGGRHSVFWHNITEQAGQV
jgi:hypothetical protein